LSTREFSQAVSCMRSKRIVRHSKFAPAMTAWGHNPNPSSTPAFPLPPATDMPAALAWAVECQFETPTEEA
jgi:hypothetical protein